MSLPDDGQPDAGVLKRPPPLEPLYGEKIHIDRLHCFCSQFLYFLSQKMNIKWRVDQVPYTCPL